MVGPGSNPTDTGDNPGHLLHRPPLAELLESSEFHHLEIGLLHIPLIVQEYIDLRLALQPGDGVNGNPSWVGRLFHFYFAPFSLKVLLIEATGRVKR